MHGIYGMGWWWLIILLVIGLVFWLVFRTTTRNGSQGQRPEKTPLDILKERYAKGEIDKEEFERRKKDLL